MRQGNQPNILTDKRNRVFAIATGSDACTEHETGSDELIYGLTGHAPLKADVVARTLSNPSLKTKILSALNLSKTGVPDLFDNLAIKANLDSIVYEESTEAGEPVAVLLYGARHPVSSSSGRVQQELRFNARSEQPDIAGAWDSGSFGFRVKGAKRVAQLREFAQAMRDGQCMFAGRFLANPGKNIGGVIIARADLLRPEHRAAMAKAQADFETKVLLQAKSRVDELNELHRKHAGARTIFAIWAKWKDQVVGGEVEYCLNTGDDYADMGPYTFEKMANWLRNGASTPLRSQ